MKRVGCARIQQIIMSARAARGERRWTIASLLLEKATEEDPVEEEREEAAEEKAGALAVWTNVEHRKRNVEANAEDAAPRRSAVDL